MGSNSVVADNVAADNVNEGIVVDAGSRITGNTVSGNGTGSGAFGIFTDLGCTVSGNTALGNGKGLFVKCPSNVIDNTSTTNLSDNLILQDPGCNNSNNVAP